MHRRRRCGSLIERSRVSLAWEGSVVGYVLARAMQARAGALALLFIAGVGMLATLLYLTLQYPVLPSPTYLFVWLFVVAWNLAAVLLVAGAVVWVHLRWPRGDSVGATGSVVTSLLVAASMLYLIFGSDDSVLGAFLALLLPICVMSMAVLVVVGAVLVQRRARSMRPPPFRRYG